MSRQYETELTVTIDGDEQDVTVRAHITFEEGFGGGWGAALDGDVEVLRDGKWVDLADLVSPKDAENAADALCELALSDDTDLCLDEERYERQREIWS